MEGNFYSKTIEFQDINYQLSQSEDEDAIFDGWCEAINYFDASVRFQFSFVNSSANKETYRERIVIPLRGDEDDSLRIEYSTMLQNQLERGNNGLVKMCIRDRYDPVLSGAVAKNLLTERIDLLKPIGRKRRTGSKAMTDTDMKYIRLYLEKTYGLTSEKKIADAADLAADANSYHPIRDYLNGLVWDGKERVRYCLRHFLGTDTDNYTFQSLRLFLLGAIPVSYTHLLCGLAAREHLALQAVPVQQV